MASLTFDGRVEAGAATTPAYALQLGQADGLVLIVTADS